MTGKRRAKKETKPLWWFAANLKSMRQALQEYVRRRDTLDAQITRLTNEIDALAARLAAAEEAGAEEMELDL